MATLSQMLSAALGPPEGNKGFSLYTPSRRIREALVGKGRQGFDMGDLLEYGLFDPFVMATAGLGAGVKATNLAGKLGNKMIGKALGTEPLLARELAAAATPVYERAAQSGKQIVERSLPPMSMPKVEGRQLLPESIDTLSRMSPEAPFGGLDPQTGSPLTAELLRGGAQPQRTQAGNAVPLTTASPTRTFPGNTDMTHINQPVPGMFQAEGPPGRVQKWGDHLTEQPTPFYRLLNMLQERKAISLDPGMTNAAKRQALDVGGTAKYLSTHDPAKIVDTTDPLYMAAQSRAAADVAEGRGGSQLGDTGPLETAFGIPVEGSSQKAYYAPSEQGNLMRAGTGMSEQSKAALQAGTGGPAPEMLQRGWQGWPEMAGKSGGHGASHGLYEQPGYSLANAFGGSPDSVKAISQTITNLREMKHSELRAFLKGLAVSPKEQGVTGVRAAGESPTLIDMLDLWKKQSGDAETAFGATTKLGSEIAGAKVEPLLNTTRSPLVTSQVVAKERAAARVPKIQEQLATARQKNSDAIRAAEAAQAQLETIRKKRRAEVYRTDLSRFNTAQKEHAKTLGAQLEAAQKAATSTARAKVRAGMAVTDAEKSLEKAIKKAKDLETGYGSWTSRRAARRAGLATQAGTITSKRLQQIKAGKTTLTPSEGIYLSTDALLEHTEAVMRMEKRGTLGRQLSDAGVPTKEAKAIAQVMRDKTPQEEFVPFGGAAGEMGTKEQVEKFAAYMERAAPKTAEDVFAEGVQETSQLSRALGGQKQVRRKPGRGNRQGVEPITADDLLKVAPNDNVKTGIETLVKFADEHFKGDLYKARELISRGVNATPEVNLGVQFFDHILRERGKRILRIPDHSDDFLRQKFQFLAAVDPDRQRVVLERVREKSKRSAAKLEVMLIEAREGVRISPTTPKDRGAARGSMRNVGREAFTAKSRPLPMEPGPGPKTVDLKGLLVKKKTNRNLSVNDQVEIALQHRKELADALQQAAGVTQSGKLDFSTMLHNATTLADREKIQVAKRLGDILSEQGYQGVKKGNLLTLLDAGKLHAPNVGFREGRKMGPRTKAMALMAPLSVGQKGRWDEEDR